MPGPTEGELRARIGPLVRGAKYEDIGGIWRELIAAYGDLARRALCREDRFYLLTVELGRLDAVHAWLYARCREVEADPDGHLDLWAREHYKSTIITFAGAIQEILRDPEITIGIFSHTKPNARKFFSMIKEELERNDRLKALFPDILWPAPHKDAPRWSDEKGIVVRRLGNPREATVEAHGLVDGQPTGAHFRLRIYDDVVTLESVSTPEQVDKTTNAWALSDNLGARGEDGLMRDWHIGTRYSFADTYHYIIDNKLRKPRIHAATHDGTLTGKPVFLTPEAWVEKLKLPAAIVAAQQLQNPAAGNEAMFKAEHLRFADVRPGTLNVYVMCDPASSRKKGSDYTAIAVIGVDAGDNWYLLDGYRHKMKLSERWQRLRDLRRRWLAEPGVQMVRVGYERFGLDDAMEYFEERMRLEKESFEIVELAWPREGPGSKVDRVQRLEPKFRGGKFFLSAAVEQETSAQRRMRESGQAHRIFTPVKRVDENGKAYALNRVFLDEYLTFPFSPTKDFVDAASRIYDMEPRPPVIVDERALEPEVFADGI